MESPFTVRENHPAGVTAGIAGPLSIVLVWIATQLGVEMSVEVAAAFAGLFTAIVTAIVSARTPRITIPDLPEAVQERGIGELLDLDIGKAEKNPDVE